MEHGVIMLAKQLYKISLDADKERQKNYKLSFQSEIDHYYDMCIGKCKSRAKDGFYKVLITHNYNSYNSDIYPYVIEKLEKDGFEIHSEMNNSKCKGFNCQLVIHWKHWGK